MDRKGSYAGYVGGLQRSQHRIFKQRPANALPLPTPIHCKTRQQHDGHRMTRESLFQTFRRFLVGNVTHGKRVVADDGIACNPDIGLCGACLLVLPRVAKQVAVQLFSAAVEVFNVMIRTQLFNVAGLGHRCGPASKNPGSFRSRSRLGSGRGGASSAVRNAFHCLASSPNVRRSAKASSARAKALSSTNSLTERCATAAAACNARFAFFVSRRSSFSVRVVRDDMCAPSISAYRLCPTMSRQPQEQYVVVE